MGWKKLLSYITGSVDQELLLRNEYLVTENRMLRQQIPGRVRLTDAERTTLAEIGKKLGRQALEEVASIVQTAGAEGRLTLGETEDRLAGIYQTTFRHELAEFTTEEIVGPAGPG